MKSASRGTLRTVRLWSGLVLFAYVTMHFINHAFGIRSIADMDAAAKILLDPWKTLPGQVLLDGSILSHLALGLHALYRRRHLRMPVTEAVQLSLGVAVPLLLIPHAVAIGYGEAAHGLVYGYSRIVYQLWIVSPDFGLPRQYLLMLVVWIHGCIGIRNWLRGMSWYARSVPTLVSLATLVPALAVLGFINAGLDMRDLVAANPQLVPPHVTEAAGSPQAQKISMVGTIVDRVTLGYIALLAGVLGLRAIRDWHSARFRAVRLTYPGGRVITVPTGFSVLEASRWAGIPHASVCGGRGRCSTCRVDVLAGGDSLPEPDEGERKLLSRIGAPPSVRLACQIRPDHDLAVVPLVHSATAAAPLTGDFGLPAGGRRETDVAALFVDLRQSTMLADDRLPYDTLFIIERYIKAVSNAVKECGGHVTNVAGDGIMSVFGIEGAAPNAPRDAFRAALRLWEAVDALNGQIHQELSVPLKVGIGLHVGVAVVGIQWQGGIEGMPFLGDTGNVAARLEAQTKRLDCTMVASKEAVLAIAEGDGLPDFEPVMLAGKQEPVEAASFRSCDEIKLLLGDAATT